MNKSLKTSETQAIKIEISLPVDTQRILALHAKKQNKTITEIIEFFLNAGLSNL